MKVAVFVEVVSVEVEAAEEVHCRDGRAPHWLFRSIAATLTAVEVINSAFALTNLNCFMLQPLCFLPWLILPLYYCFLFAGVQKRAQVMEELGHFFEQVGRQGWLVMWAGLVLSSLGPNQAPGEWLSSFFTAVALLFPCKICCILHSLCSGLPFIFHLLAHSFSFGRWRAKPLKHRGRFDSNIVGLFGNAWDLWWLSICLVIQLTMCCGAQCGQHTRKGCAITVLLYDGFSALPGPFY